MARSATETRKYAVPMDYFVGKMRAIENAGLRVSLKSENRLDNPEETGFWYRIHHGMTGASYGERITVTLTVADFSGTAVKIESVCSMPTQLFDGGKNQSNVNVLFKYLESDMASYQPGRYAPTQQAAPQVPPQPHIAQARSPRFCRYCGRAVQPGARYCVGCGKQIT